MHSTLTKARRTLPAFCALTLAAIVLTCGAIGLGTARRAPEPAQNASTLHGGTSPLADARSAAGTADTLTDSIAQLQEHLRDQPADNVGWAQLGMDYVQQAKASTDPTYYPKAEGVLQRSLALSATDNFVAMAGMAALDAARHDFTQALSWAQRAAAIDPYNSQESEGILVTDNLFTGLYDPTADGKVVPALATSKKVSDDGKTWTFTIKKGTKFTNGEAVDAESFIRGWNRVAVKSAASDVAYHMAGIQGFDDVQSGKAKTMSGLSAPDPYTLQVKLAKPDFEFDIKTTHTVFSPVPKVAGDAHNKAYNDAPIGNGPFKMQGKWEHNKSITLVRNDSYGLTKAHLDKVQIDILNANNGVTLEYQGFESGQYDWARMPTPQLPAAKAKYSAQNEWLPSSQLVVLLPIPISDRIREAKPLFRNINRHNNAVTKEGRT